VTQDIAERPEAIYRRQFFDAVMAFAPASVLDVGCGDGSFLRQAAQQGCAVAGIETDAAHVAALQAEGIDVRAGRAEALPFADGSVDCVTMQYSPHHVEDLPTALREAARVARKAVLALDPWYDVSLPSQRTALALDNWFKAVDRRTGMVHNECLAIGAFIDPLAGVGGLSFDYGHRLVLVPWPLQEAEAMARGYLAKVAGDADFTRKLDDILQQARRDGLTGDGALFFTARRD
jgi:SAM-dependent methyltransferase